MGSRKLNLSIHWGGKIISGDNGLTYDGGLEKGIRLKEGTTYEQFLSELYTVTGIDRMSSTLKITFKTPIHIGGPSVYYEGREINDGHDLAFVVDVCLDITWASLIHVYIEVVNLNYGVEPMIKNYSLSSPCRSPPMTQCTTQYSESFKVRVVSPLNVASPPQPFQRDDFEYQIRNDRDSAVPKGQQPVFSTPAAFMVSSTAPSPLNLFQFGGQQRQAAPQNPSPSPFQATSSLDFNAGGSFSLGAGGSFSLGSSGSASSLDFNAGGSFSFGSGGGGKSARRIVRASKTRNRNK